MNMQIHGEIMPPKTATELVMIAPAKALALYTTEGALDPILAHIRSELDAFVPDISTKKGRDAVASIAYKVAQSSAALEKFGKALAAEAKAIPNKIDATRKRLRDTLDQWQDQVREPLTQWEAKEKSRVTAHKLVIDGLKAPLAGCVDWGPKERAVRLAEIEAIKIGTHLEEFEAEIAREKDTAIASLRGWIAKAEIQEAEQAELAELRRKASEQAAKDRDDAIRAHAAKEAEDRAIAFAMKEKMRVEAAAQAKLDRVENAARAERQDVERRELELRLAAENAERRAAEIESRLKFDAANELARTQAETAKREADSNHRRKINTAAVAAMVASGIDRAVAIDCITLIAKRLVPGVTIAY